LLVQDTAAFFQDAFGAVAKLAAALPQTIAPFLGPGSQLAPHFFTRLRSEKQGNRRTEPEPKTKE